MVLFKPQFNFNLEARGVSILKKTRFYNDAVHKAIGLPDLCNRIIDTPQFQRLRCLMQLGMCYFVYPSACHKRFEHCIGTCYLAGKCAKILRKNQPELGIDDKDILCVYVGGLCHDLGHGPFSHTWEHFMKKHDKDYSHEFMSRLILDHMIEKNDLMPIFQSHGLTRNDVTFIKEIILGHSLDGEGMEFKGRPAAKHFLYEIVSNSRTKIDVDKFDYLLRDSKQLNLKTSFDYKRVFNESRVLRSPDHGGELRIAYRQKIRQNLEELFHQRAAFHQKAYQHKDTKIIELMILDGLNSANSEEKFVYGPDTGKWYNLSSAHKDISAFLKLTDAIFELICNWGKGGVQAETIFGNIVHRNLYKFLGFVNLTDNPQKELTDALAEHNVVLVSTHIDYGSGSENPLNSAIFYCKDNGRDSVRAVKAKNFPMPLLEKKGFLLLRHSIPEIDENNNNEVNETDITSTVEEVEKICGNFKLELQQE